MDGTKLLLIHSKRSRVTDRMRKSKRQQQLDKLQMLLELLDTSTNSSCWATNQTWVYNKINQVKGGDMELTSGGLTRDDMILANGMWKKHNQIFQK